MGGWAGGIPVLGLVTCRQGSSEHGRYSLMGGGAGGILVLRLVTCRQDSSEHGRQPHGGWGWWHSSPSLGHMQAGQLRAWRQPHGGWGWWHSSPWLGHMQAGQLRAWQAASWGVRVGVVTSSVIRASDRDAQYRGFSSNFVDVPLCMCG